MCATARKETAYAELYHRPTQWYERKALRQLLIRPAEKSVIYAVVSNSPAAQAGLIKGDEIIALNGEKLYSPAAAIVTLEDSWSNTPAQPVTLTVKRGDSQFDRTLLAVKPAQPTNSSPLLGIVGWQGDTNSTLVHPSPMDQIKESVGQITGTLGALFAPKGDIGVQQLGGSTSRALRALARAA